MYINELHFDQISYINSYLKDRNMPVLGASLLCMLQQITSEHSDPLMLADADICLRGEIGQISAESRYHGVMINTSDTPESAYKAYLAKMESERENYDAQDFNSMCATHLKVLKGQVPQYYLHLKTSGVDSVCEVLLLNADYLPLAYTMIRTEYL